MTDSAPSAPLDKSRARWQLPLAQWQANWRENTATFGDRYMDLAVIFITIMALALGWGLKTIVQNRTISFSAEGVYARVPAGWLWRLGDSRDILSATEPDTSGFSTTYLVQAAPLAPNFTPEQFVTQLGLERGQTLTAYRVLEQGPFEFNGRTGYKIVYAYVESNPKITHRTLPTVVRGADFIFFQPTRALIVTYQAGEAAYENDFDQFRQFLLSMNF